MVILGSYYQRQDQILKDEAAVRATTLKMVIDSMVKLPGSGVR